MDGPMCGIHTFLLLVMYLSRTLPTIPLIAASLKRHRKVLERREIPHLRRFYFEDGDDYPYRSHGQPLTAFASLASCLVILVVANGATLWIGFRLQTFLSAYLAVRIASYFCPAWC